MEVLKPFTKLHTSLFTVVPVRFIIEFLHFHDRERDPKKPTKGLINQLVGEKVKNFGIGMVVNTAKKVVYFVGHFDYNMPMDRKIWDDYLSKKEKWGKEHICWYLDTMIKDTKRAHDFARFN